MSSVALRQKMLLVEVTENSMSVSNCDAIKLCGVRILLYEYV